MEEMPTEYVFSLGNRLHVINLSQQSDAVDLLGGYKPFDPVLFVKEIFREFTSEQTRPDCIDEVQVRLGLNEESSFTRISLIFQKSIQSKRFKEAIKLMIKYTEKSSSLKSQLVKLRQSFRSKTHSSLIFRFVEVTSTEHELLLFTHRSASQGSLVQALRHGHWILLDEINLASSETLQLLSGILESDQGTIWLAERG